MELILLFSCIGLPIIILLILFNNHSKEKVRRKDLLHRAVVRARERQVKREKDHACMFLD